jgi:hypothetical protein
MEMSIKLRRGRQQPACSLLLFFTIIEDDGLQMPSRPKGRFGCRQDEFDVQTN